MNKDIRPKKKKKLLESDNLKMFGTPVYRQAERIY